MQNDNILQVKGLRTGFQMGKRHVEVLRGVDFCARRQRTLAIVGESGCGKSVTVHSVLQLLPLHGHILGGEVYYNTPDGNSVRLDQLERYGKEMRAIRGKEIGIIFQDPMASLNPVYTIGAQIMENLLQHEQITKKEARERAIEMLAHLGIPDAAARVNDYPHQFSGGMKQRVMIAIAMVCNPALLIADEPTPALDVTIQAQIMDLMKRLQDEEGKSIVLITHNMGLVAEMANDVAVMYMGQVIESGTVEQIFENPCHPYTRALMQSVPVLGMEPGKRLASISGQTPAPDELDEGCAFAPRCPYASEQCRKPVEDCEAEAGHTVKCVLKGRLAE